VFLLLVFLQLAVMSVMFLVSIFLSHRIAGPIYKLSKSMELARDGKLEGPIYFRKNDHFKEVADLFNSMMARLNERTKSREDGIQAAVSSLEVALQKQPSIEARASIEEALRNLKATPKA
jgi:nitrogen fixation/metabolism regulation signal transduction histidine kinase